MVHDNDLEPLVGLQIKAKVYEFLLRPKINIVTARFGIESRVYQCSV